MEKIFDFGEFGNIIFMGGVVYFPMVDDMARAIFNWAYAIATHTTDEEEKVATWSLATIRHDLLQSHLYGEWHRLIGYCAQHPNIRSL